jgi:hypothetical protein
VNRGVIFAARSSAGFPRPLLIKSVGVSMTPALTMTSLRAETSTISGKVKELVSVQGRGYRRKGIRLKINKNDHKLRSEK